MADSVSLSPNLISCTFHNLFRLLRISSSKGEKTYANRDGVVLVYDRHDAHRQQFIERIDGVEVPRALRNGITVTQAQSFIFQGGQTANVRLKCPLSSRGFERSVDQAGQTNYPTAR